MYDKIEFTGMNLADTGNRCGWPFILHKHPKAFAAQGEKWMVAGSAMNELRIDHSVSNA